MEGVEVAARSGRAGARQASVSLQCTIDAAAGEKSLAGRAPLHGIYRNSEHAAEIGCFRLLTPPRIPIPDAAGPRLIEGRIDRDTTQHRPCRVTRPARQRPETAPTGTTQRLAWTPSSSPHTQPDEYSARAPRPNGQHRPPRRAGVVPRPPIKRGGVHRGEPRTALPRRPGFGRHGA